jgi:hypothetical protein
MGKRHKLIAMALGVALVGTIALFWCIASCDAFLPTGTVCGTVISFTTGEGITGVTITVSEHAFFTTTTDSNGDFTFDVPSGNQTLVFTKAGYAFSDLTVSVIEGEAIHMESNSIYGQPVLSSGQYRIVLTWGAEPPDLDSHLITPRGEEVYFGNKETDAGDANLDVDDTTSYGPETITISAPQNGTYAYFVYNWSQRPSLTASGAMVRIYDSGGLLQTYNVPSAGNGLYWNVFTLNGSTISDINTIVAIDPAVSLATRRVKSK